MGAVAAPAKLNLRLAVLARETSGFHQIETLFATLELADTLHIEHGPAGIHLTVHGADLGPTEDNLVHRAARAWASAAEVSPGLDIQLHKRIPAGSGLGGGSSDAASTLRELNRMRSDPLSPAALHGIAATLGSDVAFFLTGAPFALAWGRGERCLRLPPPPDAPVLLGIADPPVSTASAYQALAHARSGGTPPPPPPLPVATALSDWNAIAAIAHNDFEPVLLPRLPGAALLIDAFDRAGARIARLTGSGAAAFGIFRDDDARDRAVELARTAVPEAVLMPTRTAFSAAAGFPMTPRPD